MHCKIFSNLVKTKKSQSSFRYAIKQGVISFNILSFKQLSCGVGLSGPDITGLTFRSSG